MPASARRSVYLIETYWHAAVAVVDEPAADGRAGDHAEPAPARRARSSACAVRLTRQPTMRRA